MNFTQFKKGYQKLLPQHYPTDVPENPLVSICVQTFNHENYIAECLESILAQKADFNYEILLGEDASTDSTRKICIEYAKKFPDKIRLFLHRPENKIKVDSITTGNFNAFYNFFQARGRFITFCEGDDYWTDQYKLNCQVQALEAEPNFSCTFHKFEEKFEKTQEATIELEQPEHDISSKDLIYLKHHPHLSTICFRKNFTELPEEMIYVINVDSFLLSLLGHHGPAKFLPQLKPNIYRRHGAGIWTSNIKEKKILIKINTFRSIASFYKRTEKKEYPIYFKLIIRNIYRSLFVLYLRKFKLSKAIRLIKKFNKPHLII